MDGMKDAGNDRDRPMARMRSVEDFCYRYRLGTDEQQRLIDLLGPFASERDLLSRAMRLPVQL